MEEIRNAEFSSGNLNERATLKNQVYHQNGSYLHGGRVWVRIVWLGIWKDVVLL
jgi:hypothetical protein